MNGMVTFVAPTIKIGPIFFRMIAKCFGRIKSKLRIIEEINKRINTNPTAPNMGVVFFMNTNALLHTAERPMM